MMEWDAFRLEMARFAEPYDLIICPPNAFTALPQDDPRNHENRTAFSYTMTFSLTGWPALVVRAGTDAASLPIGVQLVAKPWRDDVVLAAGKVVEEKVGEFPGPTLG